MANLLTSMKQASQRFAGAVADTGAKTMLKTDISFLERDIKARKQTFGILAYDLLSANADAAVEVKAAFEACRAEISAMEEKVKSKKREMEAIDRSSGSGAGATSSGSVGGGAEDKEAPGIPSTP